MKSTVTPALSPSTAASAVFVRARARPAVTLRRRQIGYWICQCVGWGLIGLLNFVYVRAVAGPDRTIYAAIFAWSTFSGIVISDRWRLWLRQRHWLGAAAGVATTTARLVAGIIVMSVLQTIAVALAFYVGHPANSFSSWEWIPSAVIFWAVVFLGWTAIYVSISALGRARRAELEALALALAAKEAELRLLQAQVNPHFFFNSLNSIRALIFHEREDAATAIDRLAALMRYALQSDRSPTVALEEELACVRDYLAIETIRFEERLTIVESIDPQTLTTPIPPMLLQTLVENAIKYGVELSVRGATVTIAAVKEHDDVVIRVTNPGQLHAVRSAVSARSTQRGLINSQQRLALLFGPRASVALSERDGLVTATLRLPASVVGSEA